MDKIVDFSIDSGGHRALPKKHPYILAVTPSPTLDLSGVVSRIIPNEKSYVYDQIKSPGGNGINAARILTRLGVPVVATGFLGGGVGEEIQDLLKKEGVRCRFISIRGHSRICVTVSNRSDHKQTRLTFPGPKISRLEKRELFKSVEHEQRLKVLIFGGSLPEGYKISDARQMIQMVNRRNIPSFVDCPGPVLRDLISARPFFIKPNLIEFQEATQSRVRTLRAVIREAKKLLKTIPYICVSSVEEGALLVTRQGVYFGRIPKVKILSTVGAGDSMVGAMAAQIFKGNNSDRDMLRWGLAAAAATLSHQGTAFGTGPEIGSLYSKTQVREIE